VGHVYELADEALSELLVQNVEYLWKYFGYAVEQVLQEQKQIACGWTVKKFLIPTFI
jgi:hypothetical protein